MVAGENKACKKPALLNASLSFNYFMFPSTARLKVCGCIFKSNRHQQNSLVAMFKKVSITSKLLILLTKFSRNYTVNVNITVAFEIM